MANIFGWLLDLVAQGAGNAPAAAWKTIPSEYRQEAIARFNDRFNFRKISPNHDLIRAVRLSWIEAAFHILDAAAKLADTAEWSAQRRDILTVDKLARTKLRSIRFQAFKRDVLPDDLEIIDRHLTDVMDGVAEMIMPTGPGHVGQAATLSFSETLAALTHYGTEVPEVYDQIAKIGLPLQNGTRRSFGELMFAAFAELLKDPARYPQLRVAYQVATNASQIALLKEQTELIRDFKSSMEEMTKGLGIEAVNALRSSRQQIGSARHVDSFISAIELIETPSPGRTMTAGADKYLEQLPGLVLDIKELLSLTHRIHRNVEAIKADSASIKTTQRGHGNKLNAGLTISFAILAITAILAGLLTWDAACNRWPQWMASLVSCGAATKEQERITSYDKKFQATPMPFGDVLNVTLKKARTEEGGRISIWACRRQSERQQIIGITSYAAAPEEFFLRERFSEAFTILLINVEPSGRDPVTILAPWELTDVKRTQPPSQREGYLTCADIQGEF